VRGDLEVDQTDASILFFRRNNRAFAHFGGYQVGPAAISAYGVGEPERVAAGRVTVGARRPGRWRLTDRGRREQHRKKTERDEPSPAFFIPYSRRFKIGLRNASPSGLAGRINASAERSSVEAIVPAHARCRKRRCRLSTFGRLADAQRFTATLCRPRRHPP
jgi:hypothetical protein